MSNVIPFKPVPELKWTDLDEFTRGYVECALWATIYDDGERQDCPLDRDHGIEDVAPETLADMAADCKDFQETNAELLSQYYEKGRDAAHAGHDFWLTREGHGTGFWDRGFGRVGDYLTAASELYGECYLWPGDDGLIHHG